MACYLVVISGFDSGKELRIPDGGRGTIGRSESADLHVDDSAVSRRHCAIVDVDGTWHVTDLDSSSGTFVNGERIQSCPLIPDDRIRIGSTDLVVATDDSRADDASSADLALTPDLQDLERFVGRTLNGYDILEIVAAGNRSVVFRARGQKDGRLAALKILKADFTQNEDDVQRFVRGINAAKAARSPCLVRLYAAGRKGRNCWVAMEFVQGQTLTEFIAREGMDGRLSPDQTLRLGIDLAQGLEAIREHKFLHRHATPENILYDAEHNLFKLNGLMWAKAQEGKWSEGVTVTGQVLGDIRYHSPEQLGSGSQVDGRLDLYSLGATLYFALTGRAPIQVDGLPLLKQVAAICSQVPERPGALRADVPGDLDAAVMKLLAKRPEERYQAPAELLADLKRISERGAPADEQDSDDDVTDDESSVEHEVEIAATVPPVTLRKTSRIAWLVPAVVVLMGLVFVFGSLSSRRVKQRAGNAREQVVASFGTDGAADATPSAAEETVQTAPAKKDEEPEDDDDGYWFGRPEEPAAKTQSPKTEMAGTSPAASDEPVDGKQAAMPDRKESREMASLSLATVTPPSAGGGPGAKIAQSIPIASSAAGIVSFINQELERGWKEGNFQPSPLADDAEWLRRIHLDVTGRIPTAETVEKFLADKNAARRAVMIERLLESDDYVNHWTTVWTNLSVGRRQRGGASRTAMQRYFRNAFHENRAWHKIVADLVSAAGSNEENGAANFVLAEIPGAANDAAEITDKTARLLLGIQVQCTQCHNHPFNDWKQKQFWEFNTFFRGMARVDRTRFDAQTGMNVLEYIELVNNPVEVPVYFERRTGFMEVAFPNFFGQAVELSPESNRREELARLMLAGERPLIALAAVNRMWGHFFGYGLIRPVDDMGPHNAASHPELLNRLAAEFVSSGYDRKQLIRWMASCTAYHLSSRSQGGNDRDNPALGNPPRFSHFYLKVLSPETLCDSLLAATAAGEVRTTDWEQAIRERQRLLDQFLDEFPTGGADESTSYNGSIPQSLTLMNGELVRLGISMKGGRFIPSLLARHKSDSERIRALYLTILGREPDRTETALIMQHLTRKTDRAVVYQNVCWALLNSNEFSLNH